MCFPQKVLDSHQVISSVYSHQNNNNNLDKVFSNGIGLYGQHVAVTQGSLTEAVSVSSDPNQVDFLSGQPLTKPVFHNHYQEKLRVLCLSLTLS